MAGQRQAGEADVAVQIVPHAPREVERHAAHSESFLDEEDLGKQDFLQRNDVRVHFLEDGDDPIRPRHTIPSACLMDVIGDNSNVLCVRHVFLWV